MKKTYATASAICGTASCLFGQLDFSTLTNVTGDNTFFPRLAQAMAHDRDSLTQAGLMADPGTPLYTDFVFSYDLGGDFLPEISSGSFAINSSTTPGAADGELHFRFQPGILPKFELIGGDLDELKLNIAFIHFEAAATNTFGISRDPLLVDSLELFIYSQSVGTDKPPVAYELSGDGDSDIFSFYAKVDFAPGNPPDPRPVGPHHHGEPDYWRVFQLMDPAADGVTSPALYILALEDQGRYRGSDYDFDDGFFLVQGFITPVPEPSVVGLGGVFALLGFLVWRRRRTLRR